MAARQTRRQLQFTSFEMGLIAASFLVTVTAVFFLGLFVGKKNASFHAPTEDRVARVPVDDFTKYKRPAPIAPVQKEAKEAKPSESDPEALGETVAKAAAPAAAATGESAKAASAASATMPAASPDVPAVASKAAGASTETADAAAKDAAAAKAKEIAAAKLAAAKDKEKAEAESETGRGYTVQILATRKEADADALVRKLKSRGFAAYIKKVSDGAGAWYRVRVGSYGAFSEARVMADKCRHDLGLGQAFVSTE